MKDKKASSYLDTIGSGFESSSVAEYDPATSEAQLGKEHEEEVATANNWDGDKRDAIGRAASRKRRLATKLRRIAREIEAMEIDEEYQENLENAVDKAQEVVEGDDAATAMDKEVSASKRDEMIVMKASHPMEHNPANDDPEADMPSDTGDEWIDVGPGTFDDKRDLIGRAASKK